MAQKTLRRTGRDMDMLHGPLAGKMLAFALPLAFTTLFQQLFNAADVFILGRFCGTAAMAAVGCNTAVLALVVCLFTGSAIGANVVIAHAIGQGDRPRVRAAVQTSFLLSLLLGLAMALFAVPLAGTATRILGVPEEVFPLAETYLEILLCGLPFISAFNFEAAIFRSRGDTRTPLLALGAASLLNIVLDICFVSRGMGAMGAALATDISYAACSLILFAGLVRTQGSIRLKFRGMRMRRAIALRILRIGLPAGIQGMVFSIANVCLQQAINSLGPSAMAASAAAFTIEINIFCIINAFGQTATTFVSQNYGAGQLTRCSRAARTALLLDFACMGALSAIVLIYARPLLGLFSAEPEVVALGLVRIWYVVLFEPLNVFLENLSGALRGFGISSPPAAVTLFGVCGTRLGWIFLVFPKHRTFECAMTVFPLSWAVTSLAMGCLYIWCVRRLNRLHGQQDSRN